MSRQEIHEIPCRIWLALGVLWKRTGKVPPKCICRRAETHLTGVSDLCKTPEGKELAGLLLRNALGFFYHSIVWNYYFCSKALYILMSIFLSDMCILKHSYILFLLICPCSFPFNECAEVSEQFPISSATVRLENSFLFPTGWELFLEAFLWHARL